MQTLSLQVAEGDGDDTDLQIFCVSCSHPVNPKVALRHMERCYAKASSHRLFLSSWVFRIVTCVSLSCSMKARRRLVPCTRPASRGKTQSLTLTLPSLSVSHFPLSFRATRLFCDVYNPQSKTYCKRLQVLCPEHSRDPKVRLRTYTVKTFAYDVKNWINSWVVLLLNLRLILTHLAESDHRCR